MLRDVSARLLQDWATMFPDSPMPSRVDYLGIAGSAEGGTTTFLGFPARSTRPLFAVKVHRHSESLPRAREEHAVLTSLRPHLNALQGLVPRPILSEAFPSGWVSVQSIINGRPMSASLRTDGGPDLTEACGNFGIAVRFLSSLRECTLQKDEAAKGAVLQRAVAGVDTLHREFHLDVRERRVLSDVCQRAPSALATGVYAQHGDFCRHNMLIDGRAGGSPGVIDWTDCAASGAPLHDLLFFLATYYLQIRVKPGLPGFVDAFDRTFLTVGPYSRLVRDTISAFRASAGIDSGTMRTLFGLFLVDRVVAELARVRASACRGVVPRFTASLAPSGPLAVADAVRGQFWFEFLRRYALHHEQFEL